MKPAQKHAPDGAATPIATRTVERVSAPDTPPLYAVETRKVSGEWKTFDEYRDPGIANTVQSVLRSFGAQVRIVLIEQPIIP